MEVENKQKDVIWTVFIIAIFVLFLLFLSSALLSRGTEQISVFFGNTVDFFADSFNVAFYSSQRDPYYYGQNDPTPAEHAYLPFTYFIFYCLSRFADYTNMGAFGAGKTNIGLLTNFLFLFFQILLLFIGIYSIIQHDNRRQKNLKGVLLTGTMFLSGIFFFSFERGNCIFLAVAFVCFFILGYQSHNPFIRELAYIMLAMAAALKGYPALLGILLIYEKRWFDAFRLFLYGIFIAFVRFCFMNGGIECIPIWLENVRISNAVYNASFFPRFSFRYFCNGALPMDEGIKAAVRFAGPIIDKGLAAIAMITIPFQKTKWKQIAAAVLPAIIIPDNSAFYTGLYCFPILGLFISSNRRERGDWWYVFLFILILNPYQMLTKSGYNMNHILINVSAWLMFFSIAVDGANKAIRILIRKDVETV